jgi:hypothetical protein
MADCSPEGKRHFRGITHCFQRTVQESGYSGLYRGLNVTLYSIFFQRALLFGFFDSGKFITKTYFDLKHGETGATHRVFDPYYFYSMLMIS